MKPYPAVAVIELQDIPAGILAADAMLKKAPLASIQSGTITRGRYLILVGGSTAAVDEAFQEGLYQGGPAVLDKLFLPDVHPEVFAALSGHRNAAGDGAIAVLETATIAPVLRAAEAALKGTPVRLLELRLADEGLAGKGFCLLEGALHDIEAAVDIAGSYLNATGSGWSHRILTAPHEALARQLSQSTRFHTCPAMKLDGETH